MSTTNTPPAYKQAPWRRQLQIVGASMAILVIVATITGLYLHISGQAATSGRSIQFLEKEIYTRKLEINDLQTKLAEISSSRSLTERIAELNMRTVNPHTAIYLEVPGYDPAIRDEIQEITAPETPKPLLLPEYTSSLWDWLREKIWTNIPQPPQNPDEVLP